MDLLLPNNSQFVLEAHAGLLDSPAELTDCHLALRLDHFVHSPLVDRNHLDGLILQLQSCVLYLPVHPVYQLYFYCFGEFFKLLPLTSHLVVILFLLDIRFNQLGHQRLTILLPVTQLLFEGLYHLTFVQDLLVVYLLIQYFLQHVILKLVLDGRFHGVGSSLRKQHSCRCLGLLLVDRVLDFATQSCHHQSLTNHGPAAVEAWGSLALWWLVWGSQA